MVLMHFAQHCIKKRSGLFLSYEKQKVKFNYPILIDSRGFLIWIVKIFTCKTLQDPACLFEKEILKVMYEFTSNRYHSFFREPE